MFQHTAARRRLGADSNVVAADARFNTQPPEGGWAGKPTSPRGKGSFNTQPPEGGWASGLTAAVVT